jgi:hypothetical protein
MKKLKKILIYLIIPLAVLVCAEGVALSFFDHSPYVAENITSDSKSDNSIIPATDLDLSEVDVTLPSCIKIFNLKYLPGERVIMPGSLFTQNLYFHIWQPPKIS